MLLALLTLTMLWAFDAIALTYTRPPFMYVVSRHEDKLIDDVDRSLKLRLAELRTDFDIVLPSPIRISLALTSQEFLNLTRGGVPEWAGGVAFPAQNRIVVKTPLFFDEGVSADVIVAHELAHLYIHSSAGDGYVPRWLDEGLAVVASGESRHGSLRLLANAALADRLMGLPRVDYVLGFSRPDADLAYAEARSAAQYLLDQAGWDGVRRLLKTLREGGEFPVAFKSVIGAEYEVWQVDWLDYARKRYRQGILLDIDSLIWTGTVLLMIAAVVAIYIRRRIQFRRWTEEDDDTSESGEPIHPK